MKKLYALLLIFLFAFSAYADITPLPDPPSRLAPSTFAAKADAFLGALPDFATEANQLASDVNDASASAISASAVATASANFKGEWDDLTGAAAVPYSVYHNNNYWQLLNDLADVTTSEPGVTSDWARADTQNVDTMADLLLRDGVAGEVVYLKGRTTIDDGGQGVFVASLSDLSTEVASDTLHGRYAPFPTYSVDPGDAGGWVRQTSFVTPEMFGVDGSGTVACDTYMQACIDYAESTVLAEVSNTSYTSMPIYAQGRYKFDTGVTITKPITIKSDKHKSVWFTDQDITILTTNLSHSFQYVGETIENISFLGSGAGASQNGVVCGSKAGIHTYTYCEFLYFGNNGFFFGGGATIRFDNNRVFYNRGYGVVVQGIETGESGFSTWSELKSNAFSYNFTGLWLKGTVGTIDIANNLFESNNVGSGLYGSATRPGIGVLVTKKVGGTDYENLNKALVRKNYFEDNWCGFYAESLSYVNIRDNYFDGNHPSTVTYGSSDGSSTPHGQIVVESANTSTSCLFDGNYIMPHNQQIGTGSWSISDPTTINVAYTGYADILRFKTGGYVMCGTTGVILPISSMTDNGTDMDIVVSDTSSLNTGQTLWLSIPQIRGLNGASGYNTASNNYFTMISGVTYTDPEGVYDGQYIPIGDRGVRVGVDDSISGPNLYNLKANMMLNGSLEIKKTFPSLSFTPTSTANNSAIAITGPTATGYGSALNITTTAGGGTGNAYVNRSGDFTAAPKGANGGTGISKGGYGFFTPGSSTIAYIYMSTAAPTTGAHTVGSIVFNSSPSVGQPKGWQCTAAGTPGTWVSMGSL